MNLYQTAGIVEDYYEDFDELQEEKVEEINNASAQNSGPIWYESYDELDPLAEQARAQLQNGKLLQQEI